MVKALAFKGEKKSKKRKRTGAAAEDDPSQELTLTNPTSQQLSTTTAAPDDDDDSWVTAEIASDITGPVIFALPSSPASSIACDANGKVFTHDLENIVEGDLATAEPHDVRQVWIANRVAGTEGISFKGHHGRYLSCDKFGILTATTEAISPTESFLCIPTPSLPGFFNIETARSTFLTVDEDTRTTSIRGDGESVGFNTTFRIRMQARFKPRLKASKAEKAREKISRKELEEVVGRRLEDGEVKMLKRARREGTYHEAILDVRVKGKHDKFAS
ncbi:MAG: hypothetical protein M1827_001282 [Pycnora praestabilis]|nr:MAG: hypothetical protein M1827_001282 [Pycnora praestabilis]